MRYDEQEEEQPELKPEHAREFHKRVQALNSLLRSVKRYCPDACYYLDGSGNFHLMSGPTHEDTGNNAPRYDRIMESASLRSAGGGDW